MGLTGAVRSYLNSGSPESKDNSGVALSPDQWLPREGGREEEQGKSQPPSLPKPLQGAGATVCKHHPEQQLSEPGKLVGWSASGWPSKQLGGLDSAPGESPRSTACTISIAIILGQAAKERNHLLV